MVALARLVTIAEDHTFPNRFAVEKSPYGSSFRTAGSFSASRPTIGASHAVGACVVRYRLGRWIGGAVFHGLVSFCGCECGRRVCLCCAAPIVEMTGGWIFLEDDLEALVRSRYPSPRQALRVTEENPLCHCADETRAGRSISTPPTAGEFGNLLRPKTKPRVTSSTTS